MIKKIIVFGGQGFIGSHVIDNLLSKGYNVTVFDRHLEKDKWEEYNWTGKVNFQLGDLKDRDSVLEAINLHDAVINLAGLLGTSEMINNPIPAVEVNIIGALHVFDGCRMFKKRCFQIAVGNHWMNNPYSITKSTSERFALMYNKEHGTDIRVLRGMNIFGGRQKNKPVRKIFPNVVIPALLNKKITLYGTGEQVMDLLYVKDFAEVITRILLTDDIPNSIIYEAGVGGGLTINKAVDNIIRLTNSTSEIVHVDMRKGEDKISVVEISEQGWKDLQTYISFSPADLTPFETALQLSIDWYRANLSRFSWDE